MLKKSLFTYLVIKGNKSSDTDFILDVLKGHDRRASEAYVSSDSVMVHMRILNDKEDLTNMLNALKNEFPEGVNIIANPPYTGLMASETKQKMKSLAIPALAGYIATVIGVFMINWRVLSWDIPGEALLTSLFPAAAAIFLKIYEEYS